MFCLLYVATAQPWFQSAMIGLFVPGLEVVAGCSASEVIDIIADWSAHTHAHSKLQLLFLDQLLKPLVTLDAPPSPAQSLICMCKCWCMHVAANGKGSNQLHVWPISLFGIIVHGTGVSLTSSNFPQGAASYHAIMA